MDCSSHPLIRAQAEGIDARLLDPNDTILVLTESMQLGVDNARLALDAVAWLCHSMEEANIKLKEADYQTRFLQIPPESLAALLTLVAEKLEPAADSPQLDKLRTLRPDLFAVHGGL